MFNLKVKLTDAGRANASIVAEIKDNATYLAAAHAIARMLPPPVTGLATKAELEGYVIGVLADQVNRYLNILNELSVINLERLYHNVVTLYCALYSGVTMAPEYIVLTKGGNFLSEAFGVGGFLSTDMIAECSKNAVAYMRVHNALIGLFAEINQFKLVD